MALRREIVDFIRQGILDDANQAGRVRQVAMMQKEAASLFVRILVKMIDTSRIEHRCSALDAMHDVIFLEQELREISAVLAGYSRDQRNFLLAVFSHKFPRPYTCSG